MPPPYCYDYPRPAVTVDLVVFSREVDTLRVLMIRRKAEPFAGFWALPGGFLELGEAAEAAVRRELREETGGELPCPRLSWGFSRADRDPRGWTISLAHVALLSGPPPPPLGSDDAEKAGWLDPFQTSGLAFDHGAILARALDWLQRRTDWNRGLNGGRPLAFFCFDIPPDSSGEVGLTENLETHRMDGRAGLFHVVDMEGQGGTAVWMDDQRIGVVDVDLSLKKGGTEIGKRAGTGRQLGDKHLVFRERELVQAEDLSPLLGMAHDEPKDRAIG